MGAAERGVFLIPWEQTELDGEADPDPADLAPGAAWGWSGAPLRVDGPAGLLELTAPLGAEALRARAARAAARLTGRAPRERAAVPEPARDPLTGAGFEVTDGRRAYLLDVLEAGGRLVVASMGTLPPREGELWVVRRHGLPAAPRPVVESRGATGIAEGSRIVTPEGVRPVESLSPGDRLLTLDGGAEPLLWVGRRRVPTTLLRLERALRPLRLPEGSLGPGRPAAGLRLGGRARVLLRARAAEELFGEPEVLIAAADLAEAGLARTEHALQPVVYVQLLLPRPAVLIAEGVGVESFHPAHAPAEALDPAARADLAARFPRLLRAPDAYGPPARRALGRAEAAILAHGLGPRARH